MKLKKIKLGDYIRQVNVRNSDNAVKNVKGVSVYKTFRDPTSKVNKEELKGYKVVDCNQFSSVPTTHNEKCFAFAFNDTGKKIVVTSINYVFEVVDKNLLNPIWLKMYFSSKEFDRYARFNSWGSAREVFSWDEICSVEIDLPDIVIQNKYVELYSAITKNLENYCRGLDDLKLVCDAFIENLRRNYKCEKIGSFIKEETSRNKNLLVTNVQGVNSSSSFCETKADTNGLDFSNYKVVKKDQFAYNPSRINLGSIALYDKSDDCIISPMYVVFSVLDQSKLLPEYLMLWLLRDEFLRSTLFYAVGSVRDTFDFDLMKEVEIPIPDVEIQKSIVNIFRVFNERKNIKMTLEEKIKDICPILIRCSVEEGRRS
ncbi:MAG: restriction endonuclease subunit S [Erysipelotrichaceae bacterium]|nr:restriction endonuclease subunit S [Erysipelotrichaceae bacterium]